MGGPATQRHRCRLWVHLIETSSIVSCLLLSRSCFLHLSIPHSYNEKHRLTAMNIVIWSQMSIYIRDAFHLAPLFSFSPVSCSFSLQQLSLSEIFLMISLSYVTSKNGVNNAGRQFYLFHLYLARYPLSNPTHLSSPLSHPSMLSPPTALHMLKRLYIITRCLEMKEVDEMVPE